MVSGFVRARLNSHPLLMIGRTAPRDPAGDREDCHLVALNNLSQSYSFLTCFFWPVSRTVKSNNRINCHFDRLPSRAGIKQISLQTGKKRLGTFEPGCF
jgi:hypothetical protein